MLKTTSAALALACVAVPLGFYAQRQQDAHYAARQTAIAACESEKWRSDGAPWIASTSCEEWAIRRDGVATETQRKVLEASDAPYAGWAYPAAFSLAGLASLLMIPALWRFLLNRLAEVAAAIRGERRP